MRGAIPWVKPISVHISPSSGQEGSLLPGSKSWFTTLVPGHPGQGLSGGAPGAECVCVGCGLTGVGCGQAPGPGGPCTSAGWGGCRQACPVSPGGPSDCPLLQGGSEGRDAESRENND